MTDIWFGVVVVLVMVIGWARAFAAGQRYAKTQLRQRILEMKLTAEHPENLDEAARRGWESLKQKIACYL